MWKKEEGRPGEISDLPLSITAYTEAMNEFSKNATAFIEHIPLFTKARASYEQAMMAGAELRNILAVGDQDMRTLLTQLEEAVNTRMQRPDSGKKNPEPAAVDRQRPQPAVMLRRIFHRRPLTRFSPSFRSE